MSTPIVINMGNSRWQADAVECHGNFLEASGKICGKAGGAFSLMGLIKKVAQLVGQGSFAARITPYLDAAALPRSVSALAELKEKLSNQVEPLSSVVTLNAVCEVVTMVAFASVVVTGYSATVPIGVGKIFFPNALQIAGFFNGVGDLTEWVLAVRKVREAVAANIEGETAAVFKQNHTDSSGTFSNSADEATYKAILAAEKAVSAARRIAAMKLIKTSLSLVGTAVFMQTQLTGRAALGAQSLAMASLGSSVFSVMNYYDENYFESHTLRKVPTT